MSRVLAQLLGESEPALRQQISQLERASGRPAADIRLMMQIINDTKRKVRELGLDPQDTTGEELYEALRTKLQRDEIQVRAHLNIRADGTPLAVLEAVQKTLTGLDGHTQVYAVKQSVMRSLLKKLKPAATVKRLGYRSLDSAIKHEPAALLLAAAGIIESADWQEKRLDAYRNLRPRDFESRAAGFLLPAGKNWPELSAEYTARASQNLLVLPELGSVVLLPIAQDLPGLAITTLLLAVEALNDMRSLGAYLKLQQVSPDFGDVFVQLLHDEPFAAAEVGGEPLPWKTLHWFLGHADPGYHPSAFEPHVLPEDLRWHHAEEKLARLHPSLEFWTGSHLLALLDNAGRAVSLNALDVALSAANGLGYAQRLVHHMRTSLERELMARYLAQDGIQEHLQKQLEPTSQIPEFSF